ncbi:MAG: hypothetical protein WA364_24360 [Candidatus Nitrosopolaris sp.]
MNLKTGILSIATTVVLFAGSHIVTNQAFAISTIGKIINSVVVGPCVQENGKFMYVICSKLDPSLLNNGAAVKSLLLSDKTVVKNLLLNDKSVLKSLLMNNATALKSLLLNNTAASK